MVRADAMVNTIELINAANRITVRLGAQALWNIRIITNKAGFILISYDDFRISKVFLIVIFAC